MARKIVITSGKGGVGKTTVCANLGSMLACQGMKTVLIDLDVGLNNLDVVLGVENQVVFDIFDVLSSRCRARQALIQDEQNPYLFVMPSNNTNAKLTKNDLKKITSELDDFFDYILIDCPAGIDDGFNRAISVADEAIVIVTPHIPSIRDADKVISILLSFGIKEISCIVNRVRGDLVMSREMMSVQDIYDLLQIKMLGVIPDNDKICVGYRFNMNYNGKSQIYRAFELLSENLLQGSNKIYDCTMSYRGVLGTIKRVLKRRI